MGGRVGTGRYKRSVYCGGRVTYSLNEDIVLAERVRSAVRCARRQ